LFWSSRFFAHFGLFFVGLITLFHGMSMLRSHAFEMPFSHRMVHGRPALAMGWLLTALGAACFIVLAAMVAVALGVVVSAGG
jgi:hypothetical protein